MLKALLKLFLLSAIFLQPSTSCLACKLKGEINETLGGDAALANAPKGHDKSFIVESSSHSHPVFFSQEKIDDQGNTLASLKQLDFDFFDSLSEDLRVALAEYLTVKDMVRLSRVSQQERAHFDHPKLWRVVMKSFTTDFPIAKATKVNVIHHFLYVQINLKKTSFKMKQLRQNYSEYMLNKGQQPFQDWRMDIMGFLTMHDYPKQIEKPVSFDCDGLKFIELGKELNLIDTQSDPVDINRKIDVLVSRDYGDLQNLDEAVRLNEFLVAKKNQRAINRKITGLNFNLHGYTESLDEAFRVNESLVAQDDPEAVNRKIAGLLNGKDGYKQDIEEGKRLNDGHAATGDLTAIIRKIEGLLNGKDGYVKDHKVLAEFINDLLNCTNTSLDAKILLKILLRLRALRADEPTLNILILPNDTNYTSAVHYLDARIKSMIESAAEQGEGWARYLKSQGLKYGIVGFIQDSDAAKRYILAHNIPY